MRPHGCPWGLLDIFLDDSTVVENIVAKSLQQKFCNKISVEPGDFFL